MDKKQIIILVIIFIVGMVAGYATCHVLSEGDRQSLAMEKAKPPVVKETVKTVTDTKLQYVAGETVYLPGKDILIPGASVTPVSKDIPGAVATKLDGKFDIGKSNFIYMVNGKVGQFTKTDDEKYLFDKNMMDLKQTSTIKIQAEIPTIDLTRHNVITVGAMYSDGKTSPAVGYTGSVGKVGAYQLVGGQNGGYAGLGVKF